MPPNEVVPTGKVQIYDTVEKKVEWRYAIDAKEIIERGKGRYTLAPEQERRGKRAAAADRGKGGAPAEATETAALFLARGDVVDQIKKLDGTPGNRAFVELLLEQERTPRKGRKAARKTVEAELEAKLEEITAAEAQTPDDETEQSATTEGAGSNAGG